MGELTLDKQAPLVGIVLIKVCQHAYHHVSGQYQIGISSRQMTGRVCIVSGSQRVNWDSTWELRSFRVPDRKKFGNEWKMTGRVCIVSGSQRVNSDSTWDLRSFRGRSRDMLRSQQPAAVDKLVETWYIIENT